MGRVRREPIVVVAAIGLTQALRPPVPLGIDVLGVVAGAALALHAIGVLLVYRSHRFVNFAQVAIGSVAATTFTTLVHAQPLVRGARAVCPPCLTRVTPTVRNVNYAAAVLVSLAVATGVALLVHGGFVRRFARSPRLVLTVASVFLAETLAGLDGLIPRVLTTSDQRRFALAVRGAAPVPFDVHVTFGNAVIHLADLLLVAVAAAAALAIPWWLHRTAAGTVLRAGADRPDRAATAGIDVARANRTVWILAGLLSGSAGVLTAMTLGSGGAGGGVPTALVVRILTVAAFARFTSIPLAAVAAVVIGVADQAVFRVAGTSVVLDGLLVVAVAAILLSRRPARARARDGDTAGWPGAREARPLSAALRAVPAVRSARRTAGAVAAVAVVGAPWLLSPGQLGAATTAVVHAVIGLSLLVLTGWAGEVSLGQLAVAGVAAATVALVHAPAVLALPVAAGVGAAAAVAVGLPALRLRGLELAVATLAFAVAVDAVVLGPRGLGGHIPRVVAAPARGRSLYYVALLVVALGTVSVVSMRRSRTARALIAARDNEAAAAAFGIDITRARLGAFAVSGAFAGVAGVLLMWHDHGVRALSFSAEQGLRVFVFAVVGGVGSVAGPLLGSAYEGVGSVLAVSPIASALTSGLGGLVLLALAPGGLAQLALNARDALLVRVARRAGVAVPELAGSRTDRSRVPIVDARAPVPLPARYDIAGQWAVTGDG